MDCTEPHALMAPESAPLHVLIIEDDAALAYALARYLTAQKMRVTVAGAGLAGIEADEHDPCDLMLVDLRLPDIAGSDVARDLKRRRPGVPVVVMTGNPGDLMANWPSAVLVKPFDPAELHDRIRQICQSLRPAALH